MHRPRLLLLLVLLVMPLAVAGCGGDDDDATETTGDDGAAAQLSSDSFGLEVVGDGCTVQRSGTGADPDGLEWVVTDDAGTELRAEAATEQSYSLGGVPTANVQLRAPGPDGDVLVSNVVRVRCAPELAPGADPEDTNRVGAYVLEVGDDGCTVLRSSSTPEAENLQWTIRDAQGLSLLERNALGEDRYRYFQGGTYTVVLEAWDGEGYAPVSNEVSITC